MKQLGNGLVNRKRAWTSLFIAPCIGPLCAAFMLLLADFSLKSFLSLETLLFIGYVLIMGLLISIPFMVFAGLPTIYILEKMRFSKIVTLLLYVFMGAIVPFLIVNEMNFMAAAFGGVSAFFVALIMLVSRNDWSVKGINHDNNT